MTQSLLSIWISKHWETGPVATISGQFLPTYELSPAMLSGTQHSYVKGQCATISPTGLFHVLVRISMLPLCAKMQNLLVPGSYCVISQYNMALLRFHVAFDCAGTLQAFRGSPGLWWSGRHAIMKLGYATRAAGIHTMSVNLRG